MIFGVEGEGADLEISETLGQIKIRVGLHFYMFPPKATGSHGQNEVGMGNLKIRLDYKWVWSEAPPIKWGLEQSVALWCSGSILASHARGLRFNPRAG